MYQVRNLKKSYAKNLVLNGLSFNVRKNQITCFLGKNGSGKTTLIKCLTGLLLFDSGSIKFQGQEISNLARQAYYQDISAVLEGSRNTYWYMTGEENLLYFGQLFGLNKKEIRARANPYLDLFDLSSSKTRKVAEYSLGMKQKLSIVIALLARPKVIFLDEPSLGLDIDSKYALIETLQELKTKHTIVLTSHQVDVVDKLADELLFIEEGRQTYSGTIDRFKSSFGTLSFQVSLYDPEQIAEAKLLNYHCQRKNTVLEIVLEKEQKLETLLRRVKELDLEIISLKEQRPDLESIIREVDFNQDD